MTDSEKLKNYFIGWQCRIRQLAVRKDDGRPSAGMQASIATKASDNALGTINTGLVRIDPEEITAEFRHIVKKTHDPNLRHQAAVKILASAYYQHPKEFQDLLTATFAVDSELAEHLLKEGDCQLHFEQYQQKFILYCSVKDVEENDQVYQSTFWHNRMFNPVMPAKVQVLRFNPDWDKCTASPAIT